MPEPNAETDRLDTAMSLAEVGLMRLAMGPFTGSERRLLATITELANKLTTAEAERDALRKALVEIRGTHYAHRCEACDRIANIVNKALPAPGPGAGTRVRAEDCPTCARRWRDVEAEYAAGGSPQSPPIFCTCKTGAGT